MKRSTAAPAALVLGPPKFIAPLGVMRTLGRLGIAVHGLDHGGQSITGVSRYCAGNVRAGVRGRPVGNPREIVEQLLEAGGRLGPGTVLIPASDEWTLLVAAFAAELEPAFRFARCAPDLVASLTSKHSLGQLAARYGLPAPKTYAPAGREEVSALARSLDYPVMVKPVESRPGMTVKALATTPEEVMQWFERMEESPLHPNVCIQEYIPGDDHDSWLFNGYFDRAGRCVATFTGRKLRQHPRRLGIACLVETRHNAELIDQTVRFLTAVGYRGPVDVDFRHDARDGRYKVVDLNPRLGGAFRAFVDGSGVDLAAMLYLDLIGRKVVAGAGVEGRRWVKEDSDLVAFRYYHEAEGLTLLAWLRSLRGVAEGGLFARDDPLPFLFAMRELMTRTAGEKLKRRGRRIKRVLLPASGRFRPRGGAA